MEYTREITYAKIARQVREVPFDTPVMSHEWEELVQKLCTSDDVKLHTIGNNERNAMQQKHIRNIEKRN